MITRASTLGSLRAGRVAGQTGIVLIALSMVAALAHPLTESAGAAPRHACPQSGAQTAPMTRRWETPRSQAGFAATHAGKLYAVGGNGLSIVEEYDPLSNVWTTKASLPVPRDRVTAAVATNGKLYALDATSRDIDPERSGALEEYDPATNVWTTRASIPYRQAGAVLVAATNGKIYAVGGFQSAPDPDPLPANFDDLYGNWVQEYDPGTNVWTQKASMHRGRANHGVAAAPNGKLYVYGGSNNRSDAMDTLEEYDPATDVWSVKAKAPWHRVFNSLIAAPNGNLYTVGGAFIFGAEAIVGEYDPTTDAWTRKADLPTARQGSGLVVTPNGKLYAVGGQTSFDTAAGSEMRPEIQEFDLATNVWTRTASSATAQPSDMDRSTWMSFAAKMDLHPGGPRPGVSLADLNADGRLDLAVTNGTEGSVSVFLNTTQTCGGPPTFGPAETVRVGTEPAALALGDLNGDNLPDLAVANFGSNTVTMVINRTPANAMTARFGQPVSYPVGSDPFGIAIGRLSSDTSIGGDVVVANNRDSTLSIFRNDTAPASDTPTFVPAASPLPTGSRPVGVVLGDLNGDGRTEIVVAQEQGNGVGVFSSSGLGADGVFSFAARDDVPTGSHPVGVGVGDLNGDGKPDLAVATRSASGKVSVLRNTTPAGSGPPKFDAAAEFDVTDDPLGLAIGDLNGDGALDIVVTNRRAASVTILRNTTGRGAPWINFAFKADLPTGADPWTLALGDLNGDGLPDLVSGNVGSGNVSVLTNTFERGRAP